MQGTRNLHNYPKRYYHAPLPFILYYFINEETKIEMLSDLVVITQQKEAEVGSDSGSWSLALKAQLKFNTVAAAVGDVHCLPFLDFFLE